MLTAVAVVFWLAVVLIVYTYIGYPVMIAIAARVWPRPVRLAGIHPKVSLVIVAFNEAQYIEEKLRNSAALDYPKDRLEIIVASDGSTDGTPEIARGLKLDGIDVLEFATRRGKPSVLNDVIPRCRGEIVVLGDARQRYDEGALAVLVENFADPDVGAVSGELHLVNESESGVGEGVGAYWRYEKFIRRCESRVDSTVGATGAIYAIRRQLFNVLSADALLDDVLVPLRISADGFRVVFEPRAKAFDRAAATPQEEFTRKVRTIGGNLQLLIRERWCWNPRRNRLWVQLISHKAMRLMMPFVLMVAIAANAILWTYAGYRVLGVVQLLFYSAGLGGFLVPWRGRRARWLMLPYGFCLLNFAALVGVLRYMAGAQSVTWKKAVSARGKRFSGSGAGVDSIGAKEGRL